MIRAHACSASAAPGMRKRRPRVGGPSQEEPAGTGWGTAWPPLVSGRTRPTDRQRAIVGLLRHRYRRCYAGYRSTGLGPSVQRIGRHPGARTETDLVVLEGAPLGRFLHFRGITRARVEHEPPGRDAERPGREVRGDGRDSAGAHLAGERRAGSTGVSAVKESGEPGTLKTASSVGLVLTDGAEGNELTCQVSSLPRDGGESLAILTDARRVAVVFFWPLHPAWRAGTQRPTGNLHLS